MTPVSPRTSSGRHAPETVARPITGDAELLAAIKQRVQMAQNRAAVAAVAVSRGEFHTLYGQIGWDTPAAGARIEGDQQSGRRPARFVPGNVGVFDPA
jgi:hypothetical protein